MQRHYQLILTEMEDAVVLARGQRTCRIFVCEAAHVRVASTVPLRQPSSMVSDEEVALSETAPTVAGITAVGK